MTWTHTPASPSLLQLRRSFSPRRIRHGHTNADICSHLGGLRGEERQNCMGVRGCPTPSAMGEDREVAFMLMHACFMYHATYATIDSFFKKTY